MGRALIDAHRALPALSVERIAKRFGGTRALAGVSVSIPRGEIHALLGANGSGKSTLLKLLAGVVRADDGTVTVGAAQRQARRLSPRWARAAGLRFVHQDLGLFPRLTVTENLAIGSAFPTRHRGVLDRARMRARANEIIERYGIEAGAGTRVGALSPVDRSRVAFARALEDRAGNEPLVLVLDEPTASLPDDVAQDLWDRLRARAAGGHTVLFVSHRLHEVVAVADRATVLRDGEVVGRFERSDMSEEHLVSLLAERPGAEVAAAPAGAPRPGGMVVHDLSARRVDDVSFEVRRGEVLGVAGPVGCGRSELLEAVFGARRARSGSVQVDGERVPLDSVASALRAGIALVPNERGDAGFLDLALDENLTIASLETYWDRFRLRRRAEHRDAQSAMGEFSIRATSPRQRFSSLSAGNQQKVVLARWLRRRPAILLLDDPTAGIDVATRLEVHRRIERAAADGCAVIVASDDLEELAAICSRVMVMQRGRIVAELHRPDIDTDRLTRAVFAGAEPVS